MKDLVVIWWKKIGIWQVIMALVTLVSFFVAWSGFGNKDAFFAAGIITSGTAVTAAIMITATALIAGAVALTAVAVAILAIVTANAVVCNTIANIFFVVFTAVVVVFVVALAVATIKVYSEKFGISMKAVWLSCVAEFTLILIPMLVKVWG